MLKVGDTIKCNDKEDAVCTMHALFNDGVHTDFLFEKDGKEGLWIIVEKIEI